MAYFLGPLRSIPLRSGPFSWEQKMKTILLITMGGLVFLALLNAVVVHRKNRRDMEGL
jgi:hypothetical protein